MDDMACHKRYNRQQISLLTTNYLYMKDKSINHTGRLSHIKSRAAISIEQALQALSLLNEEEHNGMISTLEFNLRRNKIIKALYLNNQ